MKKYLIMLVMVSFLVSFPAKQVYAQDDVRQGSEQVESENDGVRIVKPPASITISPKPFWNNVKDRRDEFLSKTPSERRVMHQQVKINKSSKPPSEGTLMISGTPTVTVTPQPLSVSKIKSLWNGFWSMFRKPTPNSGSMQ